MSKNFIAIIDYGMGNLRSVSKALESLGYQNVITSDHLEIRKSIGIILPGVGAFGALMANIKKNGLDKLLLDEIKSDKPYLGICLGLQILFERSHENGIHEGLGVLPGEVVKFQGLPKDLKVPHMGWNSVEMKKESLLFAGISNGDMFYFVHSYYVTANHADQVLSQTDYGGAFVSAIADKNVFGVQFHPEKSGRLGLQILDNYAKLCLSTESEKK